MRHLFLFLLNLRNFSFGRVNFFKEVRDLLAAVWTFPDHLGNSFVEFLLALMTPIFHELLFIIINQDLFCIPCALLIRCQRIDSFDLMITHLPKIFPVCHDLFFENPIGSIVA